MHKRNSDTKGRTTPGFFSIQVVRKSTLMERLRRLVLGAVIQQTTEKQSEWASKRTLRLTLVAHGDLTVDDMEEELEQLEADGLVHATPEDEYRPASDAEVVYK